ncbi:hypothetical protein UAJ10_01730 [Nitrospirillum sp. BR 11164]|uniref:hypothetical protein n=1 Tax=Nitrospirillum sp. BR 11164 TaxID=3104324 RepID=UPI002AFDD752|nr:hypothetical protein [Nitrospirillum sp. BR 11164]MEA1647738.1 hypothetical protein [Nitrospirillum sp. BR 11164]
MGKVTGKGLAWAAVAIVASLLPALAGTVFLPRPAGFALALFPPWTAQADQLGALARADVLLVDGRPGRWVVKVGDGPFPGPVLDGGVLVPLNGFQACGITAKAAAPLRG